MIFKNKKLNIMITLLVLTFISGCGNQTDKNNESKDLVDEIATKNDASTSSDASEGNAKEVDDFTKQGIWSIEYDDGTTANLLLHNDGTGYYTSILELCTVKWKYFDASNKIQITFVDNDNYKVTYTVKESSNDIKMENDNGFVYSYEGGDLSEEEKILEEDTIARGDKEEKVDGATIIRKDMKEEKIYDNPKLIYDDDYCTIEVNSLFVEYDSSNTVVYAGFDFNVVNKSEHNVWIMFLDNYIGDNEVDLNSSPIGSSWDNPLLPGKRSEKNIYFGEVNNVSSVEDLEQLSGTAQIYINDSLNSVGGGDYSYNIVYKVSDE